MQAIILAAGMGKRLGNLTRGNTKCMIEVNGVTLISRMLSQLDAVQPSLSRIILVIGYEGRKLKDYVATLELSTPIEYIENVDYATTNNIYSLALAKDKLIEEDTLLLESDLIFDDGILEEVLADPRPTLALVDKYESWMDGTVVTIDSNDNILSFIPGKKFVFENIPDYYKTVNIYKFGKEFSEYHYVPFLEAYSKAYGHNEYYEQVLRVLSMIDNTDIRAKRLEGALWYEIDDIQDLDIASSMFNTTPDQRLAMIQSRYGGYWRYPKLLDYCYLVNPYYPPQRLRDEMKANFDRLICEYPSGLAVNCLLAAKYFSISVEHVLLGNGAAELINALMPCMRGPVGLIKPTFEEYPHRLNPQDQVIFTPRTSNFSYTVKDLIEFFENQPISSLILINPDNPSGHYLSRNDIDSLLEWAASRSIRLILDESFSDFSDEQDNSFLADEVLLTNPHLAVIKSISKSFGVPGVRLGIMASADHDFLAEVRSRLSIWNINSFGEFYLQIAEKYKKDYAEGMILFRKERQRFFGLLETIKNLRVFPSQANYFVIEFTNGSTVTAIAEKLLSEFSIFIKDLTGKTPPDRQLARIAIRTSADNDVLIHALRTILEEEVHPQ